MADTTYRVLIERDSASDGAAYMRTGAEPQIETLTVLEAARRHGIERIIDLLEEQLRLLRRSVR